MVMAQPHRIPIVDAYWLLALDERGGRHVIVDDLSFASWAPTDTRNCSLWLMRGRQPLQAIDYVDRADIDDVIGAIGEIKSPERHHHGMPLRTAYTSGDCDVLALALSAVTGHDLIAVTKSTDDEGRPIRRHQLIHAAVYSGPYIYDVDGRSEENDWDAIWRSNAGCWDDGHNVPITRRRLETLQERKFDDAEIHVAANLAWLIAGLTGQLSTTDIAALRSQHCESNTTGAIAA